MSTLAASADMARSSGRAGAASRLMAALLAPATILVLLAAVLLILFTPLWVHFALTLSGGAAWLPAPAVAFALSDQTIAEVLLGPATFAFAGPGGAAFYTPDEAAHLRDVRLVLYAFLAAAVAAAILLGWALARHASNVRTWRAIGRGGAALAVALVVLGVLAALAFGVAFELFHRLLFPGGNWAFPADSNLIRLYPLGFWQLSAGAFGALGIGFGALTWLVARLMSRRTTGAAGQAA